MNDRLSDLIFRASSMVRRHSRIAAALAAIVAMVLVFSVSFAVTRPAARTAPIAAAPESSPSFPLPSASAAAFVSSPSPTFATAEPTLATVEDSAEPSLESPEATPVEPEPPAVEDDEPYPTPEPDPSVKVQVGGMGGDAGFYIRDGTTVQDVLHLITHDLDRSKCSLTQSYEPDDASVAAWTKTLRPLAEQKVTLADGWHTFAASCPSSSGKLKATVRAIAMDLKPEACKGFEFVRDDISVSSYEELTLGMVGTWEGCVATPWTPLYSVSLVLGQDGAFTAKTDETLDGNRMVALYYPSDLSAKTFQINDFQASRLGIGQIDVGSDPTSPARLDLRNVRLMGDKLEFEVFNGEYGPITFRVNRVAGS
jgi:hypothetical protein